jgi:hypothetical protein
MPTYDYTVQYTMIKYFKKVFLVKRFFMLQKYVHVLYL